MAFLTGEYKVVLMNDCNFDPNVGATEDHGTCLFVDGVCETWRMV